MDNRKYDVSQCTEEQKCEFLRRVFKQGITWCCGRSKIQYTGYSHYYFIENGKLSHVGPDEEQYFNRYNLKQAPLHDPLLRKDPRRLP